MFCNRIVEAPIHTRYALKVVNGCVDGVYGSISGHRYLTGWMKERYLDWNNNKNCGFNVPCLDNLKKEFEGWGYRNWCYDIIDGYFGNHKFALVEVGGKIKDDTLVSNESYVFEYMRIVKLYPDKITYDNLQKIVSQIRETYRSVLSDEFSIELWKKEAV